MRPRDRAALLLVTIAIAVAGLAIGGAPRWAACIAAGLGLATTLPYLTSRRTSSRPALLLLPLAVMAGLTALQLIPLPMAIAEVLVPGKVALIRANAQAWGEPGPRWVVASFDPPATLVELAKLAGYLGLAWTGVRLAAERQARRWLLVAPVGVASVVAVVTLAHLAIGTRKVYGVYQTTTTLDFVGPLVSVNHLASLLAFAVPLAAVLALRARGVERGAWFGAAALLIGTALLTGSRGGAVGLVAGLTVTGAFLVVQRRVGADGARPADLAISAPAVMVAVSILAVLVLLTTGDVARDLSRTTLGELHQPQSKYQVWLRATQLTTDHRWMGVGKGGFEPAFTPYAETGAVSYSHVENGYLQAVVDWGVPGAALVFLALGTAAHAARRRWRQGALEAGALGALAAIAVHDLADFSIELPGVAMPVIVASAILFPARLGATNRAAPVGVPRAAFALRASGCALGLVLVALAASPLGRSAREEAAGIAAAPADARFERSRDAFARHPADFLLAGRAAEAQFARRDPRALKLIARSLTMNSSHAGVRQLAGRMFLSSNRPEQAAVEFAAAARLSTDVRPVVADVVAAFPEPAQIAAALPTDRHHAVAIVRSLGDRHAAALAYARRVGEVHPRDAEMQALLAEVALAAGDGPIAVEAAEVAWELAPLARHATLLGQALGEIGAPARGIALVTSAAERTTTEPALERLRLTAVLADLHLAVGDLESAKVALERCRDLAGAERPWLHLVHLRLADIEDRLGNRNQAAWERARARELSSDP